MYDALILAGGEARRLGGRDKPSLVVGGLPLLDRVLAACASAQQTVVVGPERTTARPVTWCREDPPGGGPVPALRAGLEHVTADRVAVLAADLPFLTTEVVERLVDEAPAVLSDGERQQWLCGGWATGALREAARYAGPRLGTLLGGLQPAVVVWPGTAAPWTDCDTEEELAEARRRA